MSSPSKNDNISHLNPFSIPGSQILHPSQVMEQMRLRNMENEFKIRELEIENRELKSRFEEYKSYTEKYDEIQKLYKVTIDENKCIKDENNLLKDKIKSLEEENQILRNKIQRMDQIIKEQGIKIEQISTQLSNLTFSLEVRQIITKIEGSILFHAYHGNIPKNKSFYQLYQDDNERKNFDDMDKIITKYFKSKEDFIEALNDFKEYGNGVAHPDINMNMNTIEIKQRFTNFCEKMGTLYEETKDETNGYINRSNGLINVLSDIWKNEDKPLLTAIKSLRKSKFNQNN
jgi:hypothetical protein